MSESFEHSGKGQDVHSFNLPNGVYFCRFTISGNVNSFGDAEMFEVDCKGRERGSKHVAMDYVKDWSGRSRIVVGERDLVGVVDVEVRATAAAEWVVTFEKQ